MFLRTKFSTVRANGTKIGQLENVSLTINSGREALIGDAGIEGYSAGVKQTILEATGFCPTQGMDVDLTTFMLNDQDVDVATDPINGKIYSMTMVVMEASFKSDAKTGMQQGTFKLNGGEPSIQG